jgi:isopentenyl diphosphate isomerase/L-lactate dehydrogenase-like FMN-dependent dehydrogenase
MLVNANQRSLEVCHLQDLVLSQALNELQTTTFGVAHPSPIIMAPIGVQCIFHPRAEFNPARAGKALKVPFILSSSTSSTIEEVAEVNGDGHRWFQLYWLVL